MQKNISKKGITKIIARCGIISALYISLSLILTISGGFIDFRVGECLTLLPILIPESIISLFVGCLVINLITGCVIYDVIFGSIITLLCGLLTYLVGKKITSVPLKIFVGGLFPIIINAFLVPLTWYFAGLHQEEIYIMQVLSIMLGQIIAVYGIGSFVIVKCEKYKLFM